MTNDLKYGTSDVADLRFGNSAVSKVMLGTTQVWSPGGAPAVVPVLVDSFTSVDQVSNSLTHAIVVPAGKTIPAGSLLVVAEAVNNTLLTGISMADNANDAGSANSYSRRSTDSWMQGTNVGGYLYLSKTTREIDEGETITFTHATLRTRHMAIVAWFSGVFPDTTISGSDVFGSGSSATWATGAQPTPSVAPTLDLAMTLGTGATSPYSFGSGFTEIGDVVTTAGSADRSCALGYRVSASVGGARSASGGCSNAVWGAGLIALDYTP